MPLYARLYHFKKFLGVLVKKTVHDTYTILQALRRSVYINTVLKSRDEWSNFTI